MIKRIFATCRLLLCTMEAGALPDLYKIFFDLLTPMIHGLLRISCSRNPKHLKSAHFSTKNGYFSVFCGSISHAFSCKHETHDLLHLVSSYHKTDKTSSKVLLYLVDLFLF